MESTYGDLKVYGLITNLSINHCGLQEGTEEEKFLNLSSGSLRKQKMEKYNHLFKNKDLYKGGINVKQKKKRLKHCNSLHTDNNQFIPYYEGYHCV